jgi:spermidine synthase
MFIMGGGEGSAAREALKHKSMEKVVMCDIDQVINVQIGRKKKTQTRQFEF